MSREYVCNSCRKVITNPQEVKMKEFYFGCSFEVEGVFPAPSKRKVKVHLCDRCFRGLGKLAEGIKENTVEVVHAKWEWVDEEECGIYRCSCCCGAVGYPTDYCPNCGAKMDGGNEDG